MTHKHTKETNNKLLRLMKTPAKVLTKARDVYIHSLTGHVSYGTVMGCPMGQFSTPSSRPTTRYSNSNNGPMRPISFKGPVESSKQTTTQQQEHHQQQQQQQQTRNLVMPRSSSLGVIGRIDEDKPYCEFEEEDLPVAADVLFRSSSCCFKINWMS